MFLFVPEKFHRNIKSKYYVRPKSDAVCFAIHHFAGRVVYQADGFLEKNRNFLPPEVVQLMRQSQYDVIRFLFQCPITKTGNLFSAIHGEMDASSLESASGDVRVKLAIIVHYIYIVLLVNISNIILFNRIDTTVEGSLLNHEHNKLCQHISDIL